MLFSFAKTNSKSKNILQNCIVDANSKYIVEHKSARDNNEEQ